MGHAPKELIGKQQWGEDLQRRQSGTPPHPNQRSERRLRASSTASWPQGRGFANKSFPTDGDSISLHSSDFPRCLFPISGRGRRNGAQTAPRVATAKRLAYLSPKIRAKDK